MRIIFYHTVTYRLLELKTVERNRSLCEFHTRVNTHTIEINSMVQMMNVKKYIYKVYNRRY